MAGVGIYTQELNGAFLLQASYVHVWQSADPMSNFNNDAGAMLDNFRSTWLSTSSWRLCTRCDAFDDQTRKHRHRRHRLLGVNCGSFAYGLALE